MYSLRIAFRVASTLKKTPHRQRGVLVSALTDIKMSPFSGKPLTRELTERFSYRVGLYRIIYKVNMKEKIVEVVAIGHRATIYD